MVSDWALNLWDLYGHYKNNLLHSGGGIIEQPNLYREAMEIIDRRVNLINQRKQAQKQEARDNASR